MNLLFSLFAVAALALLGAFAGASAAGAAVVGIVIPYAALTILLGGICYRILRWASVPVPFSIATTCGQQKSLTWIRHSRIDSPASFAGVAVRMASEVLLFRSLFRNSGAGLVNSRLIQVEEKFLWAGALAFHYGILLVLLRHLRFFFVPVPSCVNLLERVDGFLQIGAPPVYLSDALLAAGLLFLFGRRLAAPLPRSLSLFADYFALWLIGGIAASGMLLRYVTRADVAGAKQLAMSLVSLHPAVPPALGPLFFAHWTLVCALAVYFPFSKLMHAGGVFLSPTRNLANDTRARRHVNPWNDPVKTHTYAEWEAEFHNKLRTAGFALEAEDGGTTPTD
jgi:nitrate reductase gamma subunit